MLDTPYTIYYYSNDEIYSYANNKLSETDFKNITKTEVYLNGNSNDNSGLARLAQLLNCNTNIKIINFKIDNVDEEGFKNFISNLKFHENLTEIDFSSRNISVNILTYFIKLLTNNTTLRSVNFSSINLNTSDYAAVADSIRNCTIREINLSHNKFGNIGTKAIFDALKSNTHVRSLSIADNDANIDEILPSLQIMLSSNQSLTHLDISGNRLTKLCAMGIADALINNYTIMGISGLNKTSASHLEQIFERNKTCISIIADRLISNPQDEQALNLVIRRYMHIIWDYLAKEKQVTFEQLKAIADSLKHRYKFSHQVCRSNTSGISFLHENDSSIWVPDNIVKVISDILFEDTIRSYRSDLDNLQTCALPVTPKQV